MRHGGIAAFPFPWPDTRFGSIPGKDPNEATTTRQRLWRTFHSRHGLGRGLHFFSGSHVNDVFERGIGWRTTMERLFWSVWKGALGFEDVASSERRFPKGTRLNVFLAQAPYFLLSTS